MAVERTYCKNNKTIRIWSESRVRNDGTRYCLKRRFYLQYEMNVCVNGKCGVRMYDNIDQAECEMKSWMKKVAEKRGVDKAEWIITDREPCTHNAEVGCWILIKKGINAKCYIVERAGELIDEIEVN